MTEEELAKELEKKKNDFLKNAQSDGDIKNIAKNEQKIFLSVYLQVLAMYEKNSIYQPDTVFLSKLE